MSSKKSRKRPISRFFWSYIKYLPGFVRAAIIRSKFNFDIELHPELELKQAESEEEITQALTLVHDSYVDLGYMQPEDSRLRFSKFLALPTSVILIAKWKNEVVGTISIISDSALGLPSEASCSFDEYRKKGLLIAEVSSLAIKKDFRMRRGKLLLPLCKLMYRYSLEVLKLDGLVASTTVEVEYFYTDILLFDSIRQQKGFKHALVQDNPSVCLFMPVGPEWVRKYKKVYNHKKLEKNLFHYFHILETPQIKIPRRKLTLQAALHEKNLAMKALLQRQASLLKDLNLVERRILQNLDGDLSAYMTNNRRRLDVRLQAWVVRKQTGVPMPAQLLNISSAGLQLRLSEIDNSPKKSEEFLLAYEANGEMNVCLAQVVWVEKTGRMGCTVIDTLQSWHELNDRSWAEFTEIKIKAA